VYRVALRAAPVLRGLLLGPLLDENLRRAMILARGHPTTFVTLPISAALLPVVVFLPAVKEKREDVFVERN
jgi:putative tricarboxylic transport membrane protein